MFRIFTALFLGVRANLVNFRGSGKVAKADITSAVVEELQDAGHHVQAYEDALQPMFASLPKDAHGNVEPQMVRYALHRYFVDRHGWYIRGLDPSYNVTGNVTEWVPEFLQSTLEAKTGQHGASLHGLAVLAASLVDLGQRETRMHLMDAYMANKVVSEVENAYGSAREVINTFFMSFLVANNWTSVDDDDLAAKKLLFRQKYTGYDETMTWFQAVLAHHMNDTSKTYSFAQLADVAYEISRDYHSFNDRDCQTLITTLRDMQGRRPGRVRLSTFYNMSLYGHWAFTEKVDYLRVLGTLDESDPKVPAIVIPNYVMARLNCLNATSLYSICCRNTCEDLVTHLESQIGGPTASPARIISLVSKLPSASVTAPRELSETLSGRLRDVAVINGGEVPLHGRLFAQWMHHAYPLECPYPFEAGTTNPQSPEEWAAETGKGSQADSDEMRQHVEADVCAINWEGKPECGDETVDLPWSMKEELITTRPEGKSMKIDKSGSLLFKVFGAACLVLAGLVLRPLIDAKLHHTAGDPRLRVILAILLSATSAYSVDLLDGMAFGLATLGSAVALGMRLAAAKVATSNKGKTLLPMQKVV